MTKWEKLVEGDALNEAYKIRKEHSITVNGVTPSKLQPYLDDGYEIIKTNKNGKHTVAKKKSFCNQFEDEVWCILYKMGFTRMNDDNHFVIEYPGSSKQVDIVAMDDETCIFVECKSTETFDRTHTFKTELDSIDSYYKKIKEEIEKQYGKRNFAFIFATKNYLIKDDSADMERINAYNLIHFDNDAVSYYSELVKHLGKAARFQLLGNLFREQEIEGIDNKVPAIKSTMAGTDYYLFSIEPERLLKLSYVHIWAY